MERRDRQFVDGGPRPLRVDSPDVVGDNPATFAAAESVESADERIGQQHEEPILRPAIAASHGAAFDRPAITTGKAEDLPRGAVSIDEAMRAVAIAILETREPVHDYRRATVRSVMINSRTFLPP